jgi:hypothetical protein
MGTNQEETMIQMILSAIQLLLTETAIPVALPACTVTQDGEVEAVYVPAGHVGPIVAIPSHDEAFIIN